MHDERLVNLLGAAALALTDRMVASAATGEGVSRSGATALAILFQAPGLSVTELGRQVGLSQPAAARMVDALEAAGLVERHKDAGRAVSVRPTRVGRRAARRLLTARSQALADVTDALDGSDRRALADLLEKLLARLYVHVGSADLLCRLCDRAACTADAPCPVGAAERADHQS